MLRDLRTLLTECWRAAEETKGLVLSLKLPLQQDEDPMASTTFTLRVETDVKKRVEKLAKSTARSRSFLFVELSYSACPAALRLPAPAAL